MLFVVSSKVQSEPSLAQNSFSGNTSHSLHLLVDEKSSHTLPLYVLASIRKSSSRKTYGSNAHTRHQHLLLRPPGFTKNGADLPSTSRTQRMTQCNSTASRVDLCMVQTQHI